MLDFTVPSSPGWGKRILEEEGSEEGQVGAISPKMLAAIDVLRGQQYHVTERMAEEAVLVGRMESAQATGLSHQANDAETEHATDLVLSAAL
jgi:ABC-type arginine transport system permease subunit